MTGQENKRTQDDVHEAVEQDSETTEDLLNTVCGCLKVDALLLFVKYCVWVPEG